MLSWVRIFTGSSREGAIDGILVEELVRPVEILFLLGEVFIRMIQAVQSLELV